MGGLTSPFLLLEGIMEYKGYNISEVESLLLLDILQVQQEILAELKKLNERQINIADGSDARQDKIRELLQEEESIGLTEDSPEVTEAIVQATDEIEKLDGLLKNIIKAEVQPVEEVKKPAQKKPATKKKSAKKRKPAAKKGKVK
jgi:hypothetical protein